MDTKFLKKIFLVDFENIIFPTKNRIFELIKEGKLNPNDDTLITSMFPYACVDALNHFVHKKWGGEYLAIFCVSHRNKVIWEDYLPSNILLISGKNQKNGADDQIMRQLRHQLITQQADCSVILASGDGGFIPLINDYMNHGHEVCLVSFDNCLHKDYASIIPQDHILILGDDFVRRVLLVIYNNLPLAA